jgi:hypothetical protein
MSGQASSANTERRSLRRRITATVAQVALGVLIGVAGTQASSALESSQAQPEMREQIDAMYREVARQGRRVATRWQGTIHGVSSLIVVIRAPRAPDDAPTPADEIRIYDFVDHHLELMFRFAPRGEEGTAFRVSQTRDLDHDGHAEVIGAFDRGLSLVPIVMSWSDAERRYVAAPLVSYPVGSRYFATRQFLRDRFSDRVLWGYPVTSFAIVRRRYQDTLALTGSVGTFRTPRARRAQPVSGRAAANCAVGPRVATRGGFIIAPCAVGTGIAAPVQVPVTLDVRLWRIGPTGAVPRTELCGDGPTHARLGGMSPQRAIRRLAEQVQKRWTCAE